MTPTIFARSAAALGFVHNRLDRAANSRDDGVFIDRLRHDPACRTLLVLDDAVLLRPDEQAFSLWFDPDWVNRLGTAGETVFLGRSEAGPRFATRLEPG